MSMRRPIAIAVLPLMVIVGFQSAWAAFACRIDGQVRDRCCCPEKKRDRDDRDLADAAPRIIKRSCCEISFHDASDAPVAREADRAEFAHLWLMLPTVSVAIIESRVEREMPVKPLARPPPRVALYLDKHAILR